MTAKKKSISKNRSKGDMIQGYQIGLRQRPVSGTIKSIYSSFDDTANLTSVDQDKFIVPKIPSEEKNAGKPTINWTIVGIVITVILTVGGATYKFGILEKSVEMVQGNISDLQKRMEKNEDNYKKDYKIIDDKLNTYISKSKK